LPTSLADAVDREISRVEEQVLAAAEAMPEDRFDFSPESLRLPGSAYQGVRTFAVQVRHIAASNYFIWSPLAGERLPDGLENGEGPPALRSRSQILGFLRSAVNEHGQTIVGVCVTGEVHQSPISSGFQGVAGRPVTPGSNAKSEPA